MVIEHKGHFFIHTSGVGINRINNSGAPTMATGLLHSLSFMRGAAQMTTAGANDMYGPLAFQALDQESVKYINSKR